MTKFTVGMSVVAKSRLFSVVGKVTQVRRVWSGRYLILVHPENGFNEQWFLSKNCRVRKS